MISSTRVSVRPLQYATFFLYIVAISAFNLGEGFDAVFKRVAFALFFLSCLLPRVRLVITTYLRWLLLFWGFYFLSVLWASDWSFVVERKYTNLAIMIIGTALCAPVFVKTRKDVDAVLRLFVLAALITIVRLWLLTPAVDWGSERIGGAIGHHPNGLGLVLSTSSVITWYIMRQELARGRRVRAWLYLACAVVMVVVTLLTGSRKSVGYSVLGIAVYETMCTKGGGKMIAKIAIVAALLVVVWNIIMTNEYLYAVLGRRFDRMIDTMFGGGSDDGSVIERNFYRAKGWWLFTQHPLLGYGGNNFARYIHEIHYPHAAYSHCGFVEILSGLGITGFLIYYGYYLRLLWRGARRYLRAKAPHTLLFTLLAFIILVTDYYAISYQSLYSQLMLLLFFLSLRADEKKTHDS